MSTLNPYLNFRDNAREAMTFYQSVLGGELTMTEFGAYGAGDGPAEASKLMHAELTTPKGYVLMGADTPARMPYAPSATHGVSISGDADELDDLKGYFDALAEGAEAMLMPWGEAPWGAVFGMLTDRFGIGWIINVQLGTPA